MRDLAQWVQCAQKDETELTELIETYLPFIRSAVLRHGGREEHLTVGMEAFTEAVRVYSPEKGSFLKLADLVIRRRVTDALRKENSRREEACDMADEAQQQTLVQQAHAVFRQQERRKDLVLEIQELSERLGKWGIEFTSLAQNGPKHAHSRRQCLKAAAWVAKNGALRESVFEKGVLQVQRISKETGIPAKTLEKFRKYIVAASVICIGDYPLLRGYLPMGKEGSL